MTAAGYVEGLVYGNTSQRSMREVFQDELVKHEAVLDDVSFIVLLHFLHDELVRRGVELRQDSNASH